MNPLSKAVVYIFLMVVFYFVAVLFKEEKNCSPEHTHLLTGNEYVVSTMPGTS